MCIFLYYVLFVRMHVSSFGIDTDFALLSSLKLKTIIISGKLKTTDKILKIW